jgi:hypothetical protein
MLVHRIHRGLAAAALLTAGALVAGQAGAQPVATAAKAKKTYTVSYATARSKPPTDLSKLRGTLVGKPFGTASFTGATVVPITTYQWRFKGGVLKVKFTATLKGVIASGPWKVTGGTGKFKGATGGGKASGGIDGSKPFKFTGKVKF